MTSEELHDLQHFYNYDLEQMAELAEVKRPTIAAWKSGINPVTKKKVKLLFKFYEFRAAYFNKMYKRSMKEP